MVHEGEHNTDLLPVTFGEGAHRAIQDDGEPLDELVDKSSIVHASRMGYEIDMLAARQAWVQGKFPWQVADLAKDRHGVAHGIVPEYLRLPRRGAVQAKQETERRGLAGAVRTQEAEHLSLSHFEVEIGNASICAEGLSQAIDFDYGSHVRLPSGRSDVSVRVSLVKTPRT